MSEYVSDIHIQRRIGDSQIGLTYEGHLGNGSYAVQIRPVEKRFWSFLIQPLITAAEQIHDLEDKQGITMMDHHLCPLLATEVFDIVEGGSNLPKLDPEREWINNLIMLDGQGINLVYPRLDGDLLDLVVREKRKKQISKAGLLPRHHTINFISHMATALDFLGEIEINHNDFYSNNVFYKFDRQTKEASFFLGDFNKSEFKDNAKLEYLDDQNFFATIRFLLIGAKALPGVGLRNIWGQEIRSEAVVIAKQFYVYRDENKQKHDLLISKYYSPELVELMNPLRPGETFRERAEKIVELLAE